IQLALAPHRGNDPNAVDAIAPTEQVTHHKSKDFVNGKPAVYVCERFVCQSPVTDPKTFTDP
ncbi:MAG: hypothetical protein ACRDKK_02295, partial [Gaiellaceae bacterium]